MSASLTNDAVNFPLHEDQQSGNRIRSTNTKRKASVHEEDKSLGEAILIRQYGTSKDVPKVFQPKQIIPRSALPLACIRPNTTTIAYPQLFKAYIRALEKDCSSEGIDPKVLIVQEEDASLAAVERISQGIYTICPLAPWVTLQDFGRGAAKQPRVKHNYMHPSSGGEWWHTSSIQPQETRNSTRLLDFVLADKPRASAAPTRLSPKKIEPTLVKPSKTSVSDTGAKVQETEAIGEGTHVDWKSTLRQQYLEALYTSRAPLAYFVKGALSRARVAMQTKGSDESMSQMLRTSILPIKLRSNAAVIDKKYNQAIQHVIDEIPSGITIEDSGAVVGLTHERVSKSKRRKKLTGDGLFPGEEEYIINWWVKRESNVVHEGIESTREQRIKRALMEQKMRETQLQIILLLETLALEQQSIDTEQKSGGGAHLDDINIENSGSKRKPPQDLPKTLDTLVEKLQIWETMSDDILSASTSHTKALGDSSSCLRSFCLDIVLPFYTSRLAGISKDLCQKFGVVLSPEKKLTRSTSSNKPHAKPGEPVKSVRSVRPLHQAAAIESASSKRKHPSLTRSATDSLLPNIKQELEDVSMSSIPLRRPSIHQSRLYARREVDLAAEVKATEAKLKKKAQVEQELQGAIFALRKPNARLAVKEFVNASDQRNVAQKSRSRKPQNPMRNPFATGIQVTATPKVNRYKRSIEIDHELPNVLGGPEQETVPPSSAPRIPSSSMKSFAGRLDVHRASMIAGTPSKAPKASSLLGFETIEKSKTYGHSAFVKSQISAMEEQDESSSEPELPPIEPVKAPRSHGTLDQALYNGMVTATPIKIATSNRLRSSQITSDPVFSTPRKSTSDGQIAITPIQKVPQPTTLTGDTSVTPVAIATSIYDALGWDNDFDDM